ncbi:SDR family oxidoreductase [Desulfosudis oleivorans]|uniref:Short-chain dehydrogenase/reductase SDR n=1 Tax=Desulfosudis oleivorans (strain DSM 6200 / JCM 39069 / Hxd3) TaxID=96561 RepID=A8ZXZ9_DESOH|nr:SDR family oxidoreductase [Desulfosudis oleivorans]ABW68626.1 short-chain dehydrogenase/reductase SDR [Desulfosudis oleivorans Hxd3]
MKIKNFTDKKCFITGAASGIGRSTALAMARRGARLFLTDINAEPLEAVVKEIEQEGGTVAAWEAFDIRDLDRVRAFSNRIHQAHGAMDIVMNVAGTAIWGTVDRLKHIHWKTMIDINLMGPINVIECMVSEMVRAGQGGHLVNVSSAAGLIALPWHAAYSASKFGLRGLSEVLRYDLRPHRIGVTVVCPGAVKTPLVGTAQILGVDKSHKAARKMIRRFEKHAVTPEKVAADIIQGIEKNRYMVITSFDIRMAWWAKRRFFFAYHLAMIVISRFFRRMARKAAPAALDRDAT